ncbi:MAG: outer membrane beta-barrel protein [Prevotella sp.]|nr:outer membrane beta-barrel protein [Prevotella sp.]
MVALLNRKEWGGTGFTVRVIQGVTILIACHLSLSTCLAQDQPEYRLELGAGAGLMSYQGDFSGSLLKSVQPMGGAVAKYKLNPRMSWAGVLNYGQLKGSSSNAETWYPELSNNPISFSTNLVDFNVCFEYNFWPFGTGREYFGAKPLTPFIAIGGGLAFAKSDNTSAVAFQMPVGVGVKYKLAQRLNLTAELLMHISGSDKLDGIADPYGIKSTGMFKNTDCFSTLQVSVTYDLWARCKTCMNDED